MGFRHLYRFFIFFSNALKNIESVELYGISSIIVVAVGEYFRHPPGEKVSAKCRSVEKNRRFYALSLRNTDFRHPFDTLSTP